MNINELRTRLDNIQMSIIDEDPTKQQMDQIAFTNSEIVILNNHTIHNIEYDPEKKETRMWLLFNPSIGK